MPADDISQALEEAAAKAAEDKFWATRGKAVQAYARLEQALCQVFAAVCGMDFQFAGIIFFKITSGQARTDILDKLLRLQYSGKYNKFWNSVLKEQRRTDLKRNEIVHWLVSSEIQITTEGFSEPKVLLHPPTYWVMMEPTAPSISTNDLMSFIEKCDFHTHVCNAFAVMMTGNVEPPISEEETTPWLELFLQPLIYPLPAGVSLPPRPRGFGVMPTSIRNSIRHRSR